MHVICLLCLGAYITFVIRFTNAYQGDEFGVIMDGGSSGTKLKIYRWRQRQVTQSRDTYGWHYENGYRANDGRHLDLKQIFHQKFTPGISEMAYSLQSVDKYLCKILDLAIKVVPRHKYKPTNLFFFATAGLRILPISVTERLLDKIETVLQNSSLNPFTTRPGGVRVLSGEEEGVFAWVAANYLRGYFWADRPYSQSVGVLEMGGGSTQIAFLPAHSIYSDMFPVRIGGRTYRLYAHSYLFYGQNYIVSRINDYLVALQNDILEVKNPCMLIGDNVTHDFLGTSVHIHGSANVSKCLEIIDFFLKTADDNWCYPKPCAIGRTYQPPVGDVIFYAISAFVYAPKYLNAIDELGRLNLTLLNMNTVKYCNKTLAEVTSSGLKVEYASPYCTMGLYIPSLILNAYGFNVTRNVVYVKNKINNVHIDWSLGAMLLELENMLSTDSCVKADNVADNVTHDFLGTSVHIHGSANVSKCLEIIDFFLKTADDNWCYPKPCAIGRTYQPPVGDVIFYAISAFVYAPKYLNAIDELGRLNLTLLNMNTVKYCNKTLAEVTSSGLKVEYASPYCTMGLYIPSLILNAYGFNVTRNVIYVKNKINNVHIDWSLGAMLLELENMLSTDSCVKADNVAGLAPSIIPFVVHWYIVFTGVFLNRTILYSFSMS